MTKAIVVRSKAAIKRWQEARARGSSVPEYLREEKPRCAQDKQRMCRQKQRSRGKEEKDGGVINQRL